MGRGVAVSLRLDIPRVGKVDEWSKSDYRCQLLHTCHDNNFDEVLLMTGGQRAMNFFFIYITTHQPPWILELFFLFWGYIFLFSTFYSHNLLIPTRICYVCTYTHICWIGGGRCWRNYFVYFHQTYNFSFIFFLN